MKHVPIAPKLCLLYCYRQKGWEKKKRALISIIIIGMCPPTQAGQGPYYLLGIGGHSCAYWQSEPQREHEGQSWIAGYWSAINMVYGLNSQNSLVGSHSDPEAIVAEIGKICSDQPSM